MGPIPEAEEVDEDRRDGRDADVEHEQNEKLLVPDADAIVHLRIRR